MTTRPTADASDLVPGLHRFERAGLGAAPYTFLGIGEYVYQAIPGDPSCPVQPGTSCDYCGQGIRWAAHLRSADGRTFKVGCDCVYRAHEPGKLVAQVEAAERKRDRDRRAQLATAAQAALTSLLSTPAVRAQLADVPHPKPESAARGATMLDWADWMLRHAGAQGRQRVLQQIRKLGLSV